MMFKIIATALRSPALVAITSLSLPFLFAPCAHADLLDQIKHRGEIVVATAWLRSNSSKMARSSGTTLISSK
jgi:hypothetical protein